MRIRRLICLLGLSSLALSSGVAAQAVPWTPELTPDGCPVEAPVEEAVRGLQAALGALDAEARDDPSLVWETIGAWFDTERGMLVAADTRSLIDGTHFSAHAVFTGEALKQFVADEFWVLELLSCSGMDCESSGGHSYRAVSWSSAEDGRLVVSGMFHGDDMVVEEREIEVSRSRSSWRRGVDQLYGADVTDILEQAHMARAFANYDTARSLLEGALVQAPDSVLARQRLATLLWDLDELEALQQVVTPLTCDGTEEALKALSTIASAIDVSFVPHLAPLFVEVMAHPPADPIHIPSFLQRFQLIEGSVGPLIESSTGLRLIHCPDEVWEAEAVTDELLASCPVQVLRWRVAVPRMIEIGIEIDTWDVELLDVSYTAIAGFDPTDESDVIVMSPDDANTVALIVRFVEDDFVHHLDAVIGYALTAEIDTDEE